MKKFLVALAFGCAMLSTASAQAILIEPFIGYQMGEFELGTASAKDVDGVEFGARLGATFTMFALGAEYATADISRDGGADFKTTDMGVFFSVEFPVLIRAFATYFVSSTAKPDGGTKYEGDGGYRIGLGFTGLPFVSVNFEHIVRSYDEQGSTSVDADMTTNMISLSLPLP